MSSSFFRPLAAVLSFAAWLPLALASSACTEDVGGDVGSGGSGGGDAEATSGPIIVGASTGTSSGGPTSSSSAGAGEGGAAVTTGEGGDDGAGGSGGGDGGAAPGDPCPDFASEVVDVAYGPGAGFGQEDFPGIVLGGPRGAGAFAGSLDVLSLGNGGSITLGFAERRIVDGEGPDFIVFENAFWAGGNPDVPYAELGTVEVSADGEAWVTFPCTALAAPFGACAGWQPVYANVDDGVIDPLDPAVAGGEAFDLADVGLAEARYVRIVDRADQAGFNGMFDLDAVAIVHGTCDAAR